MKINKDEIRINGLNELSDDIYSVIREMLGGNQRHTFDIFIDEILSGGVYENI